MIFPIQASFLTKHLQSNLSITTYPRQIYSLNNLSAVVLDNELRVVTGDEGHFETLVCVTVAGLLKETAHLRQAIQLSSKWYMRVEMSSWSIIYGIFIILGSDTRYYSQADAKPSLLKLAYPEHDLISPVTAAATTVHSRHRTRVSDRDITNKAVN